jgi:exopolyphosphatase/guanosine-5'-triphosphate,3'-diphosphate pyrophosphatase
VDAAMRSVRLLADRCDDRPEHSQHVARIAGQLFDLLHQRLGLDASTRRLLEAGSLLANVGVVISHSKHHLHSYYVIRNSELVGLSDREIELIAQVARYHRKGLPKLEHKEFAALDSSDQHIVRALAAILRIAVDLNISFTTSKKLDNELNEFAANERRSLLAEVLGVRVKISAS